jgi:hypothetical protein
MLGLNEDFATGSSQRQVKSGLFVICMTNPNETKEAQCRRPSGNDGLEQFVAQ